MLRYTVDTVQGLLDRNRSLDAGWTMPVWVSDILLGTGIISTLITFGQNYYGEKIRIYPSGTTALHDVSLTIEAGKTTALASLSGADKSTIINPLCQFYRPNGGEMLRDGRPLAEYDTFALDQQIGLVLQKNHG